MKIRTDFVTNSSSSSFVVEVSVEGKDGNNLYLNTHYNPDGNEDADAEFNREDILEQKNISELADYLIGMIKIDGFRITDLMTIGVDESIKKIDIGVEGRIDVAGKKVFLDDLGTLQDGITECIEELEGELVDDIEEADIYIYRPGEQNEAYAEGKKKNIICVSGLSFIEAIKEYDEDEWEDLGYNTDLYKVLYIVEKLPYFNSFREKLIDELKSVDNISSICITKRMDSWGEGSGCTVINDEDLCELLDEVREATGEEKKKGLDRLEKYLKFPFKVTNGIESFNVPDEMIFEKKSFVFAHLTESEVERLTEIINERKGNIKKTVTDKIDYVIYNPTTVSKGWVDKVWDKENKKIIKAEELHESGNGISLMTVRQLLMLVGIEYEENYRQYSTDGWKSFPSGMTKSHWEYDWSEIATTIEEFVENTESISNNDEGYEEVLFDMISKTVSEKAIFTMKKGR